MTWSNPQRVGSTPRGVVVADLGPGLFHPALTKVQLTQPYTPMRPPGYPTRESPGYMLKPGTVQPVGTVLNLLKPEAEALIAQGSAVSYPPTLPPANVTPPRCSGPSGGDTEVVGATLSCTKGTWSNADDAQTDYQWERDEAAVPDATSDEYPTGYDDFGCALRCWVRVKNAAGAARAVSNEIVIVDDAAPEQHPERSAAKRAAAPAAANRSRRRQK
jgi:hypothetical protein